MSPPLIAITILVFAPVPLRLCPSASCSFPGLYESLHHRARGAWEQALWNDYISYKARVVPLPWNEATIGNVDEDKVKEMRAEIADKCGLSPKQVGLEK